MLLGSLQYVLLLLVKLDRPFSEVECYPLHSPVSPLLPRPPVRHRVASGFTRQLQQYTRPTINKYT